MRRGIRQHPSPVRLGGEGAITLVKRETVWEVAGGEHDIYRTYRCRNAPGVGGRNQMGSGFLSDAWSIHRFTSIPVQM